MIALDRDLLIWIALAGAAITLASWVARRTWRRFLQRARGPASAALGRDGGLTDLDRMFDPLEAAQPGQSGLMTLLDNADAFAARAVSAQLAGRSLDLMYYIWRTDLTGWLLIDALIAAADRGVRIRLLLDDVNVQGYDRTFLALGQHRLIEVRLFNPTRNRGLALRRAFEMALGLTRFNRRMHGKLWIADGRLAILGGRNIGDTYFGAQEGKPVSVDADVMLAGPKVDQVAALFDSYWNTGLSLPIRALWPAFSLDTRPFRRRLARKTHQAAARPFLDQTLAGRTPAEVLTTRLHWTDKVTLLADPPQKAYGAAAPMPQGQAVQQGQAAPQHQAAPQNLTDQGLAAQGMSGAITALIGAARHEVLLITPYFVPGQDGMAGLTRLAGRGVRVALLTNALKACDKVLVFGAYRHYRTPLLAAGARVFEFSRPGKSDVLHSKVFVIDRRQAVIGSLNFDLRSAHTNTELGLLFDEPALVAELCALFDGLCAPDQAFEVTAQGRRLHWAVRRAGLPATMQVEPEATALRRTIAWIVGILPIEAYL